jgi:large subunit ribosomal protein L4e
LLLPSSCFCKSCSRLFTRLPSTLHLCFFFLSISDLQAIKVLEAIGAADDVKRVEESRSVRAGKGKGRNRRFVSRRGPLLIVSEADGENVIKAFRNLPGVDVANVDRLNLLQLAPGGHVGRFCIWSKAAFERLGALYGSATVKSSAKSGYLLPRAQMHIADLGRLINSTEIQAVIRPAIKDRQWAKQKKNPLRNKKAMDKLNPYAAVIRKQEATAAEQRKAAKGKKVAQKRATKVQRAASKAFFRAVSSDEFVRPSEA